MDKAAIYCRLSKEDEHKIKEGDESESIQNQKLILTEYAARNGFILHEIYADDDYSGLDSDRPAFNQMIQDAKKGLFNTVICKSQSRFTRDMEIVEKYLHGLFPLLGIRFIGVVDHVDTNINGNKKARQINGLINEWYCEDLSESVKSVYKSKMKQGQFLGAFAPYGYIKDPEDRHKLIIDNEAAKVVKKIYQLYMEGLGVQKIRNRLYEEGIPTPTIYKTNHQSLNYSNPQISNLNRQYGFWASGTIKKILTNETYTGSVVQGRERKVSYKSKKIAQVPKSEWYVVPNCHEPIITKEDFEFVQKIMHEKRREKKHKYMEPFLYSGKVFCKNCGSKMTRAVGRKGQSYLYCQVNSRSHGKECEHNSIKEESLTEIVERKIHSFIDECLKEPNVEDELSIQLGKRKTKAEELRKKRKERVSLNESLESVKKAVAMLYVDKISGKIVEEEYNILKDTLMWEIQTKEKTRNKLDDDIISLENQSENTERVMQKVRQYAEFQVLTQEILLQFVDYIEIASVNEKNKEVAIHWNI